ncbi:hypothetical protein [Pseudarthrobacter sp. MM222]|uniref:hypothetical protein n=1 Tax=Pseudarthrobacter sp. MM222 TaxID=3018929 RepID=UPI0022200C2D|nr:hypothetical protein [Pseudarthrobacter sp. MM222]CAI3793994.1 hypothetical protein NKCBBBOE_00947 [Pseudarthrobacter sp. MM222]
MIKLSELTKRQKWLWGSGIVLALAAVGSIVGPADDSPGAATSTTVNPAWTPAAPSPSLVEAPSPTQKQPAKTVGTPSAPAVPEKSDLQLAAWADDIDRDARAQFGVKTWQQLCTARIVGDNWGCLVMDMDAEQEGSLTVLLNIDKNAPDAKRFGESAAHALFKLLGDHPELEWIQAVHATGGPLATVHRSTALPNEK